jgi:hypothetical protein
VSSKEDVENGWEILSNSKAFNKKKIESKNLLSTIPKEKKGKESQENLRKEADASFTKSSKDKEEEVVEIIDRFRKGDLNAEAETFIPQRQEANVEPDEVVDIINQDCRSTEVIDRTKRQVEIIQPFKAGEKSNQKVISSATVNDHNEINAKCESNLRKVTEVKQPRKRGNFEDNDERKKFQGIIKRN